MSKIKKIYVVGNQQHYANFINNIILVDNIKEADIVIFTGGEDVDPKLYGCKPHRTTCFNTSRDLAEQAEFKRIKPHQLAVGICRGSQFLCVMNGGKLIQNVTNHAIHHTHSISGYGDACVYEITSTHHQMQYPFNIPKGHWKCLFYAVDIQSIAYEGDNIIIPPYEPEVVLYHKPNMPKCLAIQGHPEYMRPESQIVIKLNEIINNLLVNED